MNILFFIFLVSAFIVSSCGIPVAATSTAVPMVTLSIISTTEIQPTNKVSPTVAPVCISSEPTQADIDRALAYTGELFSTPDWEQSYSLNGSTVTVLWQGVPQSALVYLEARNMPCGYGELDLNKDFSDENWKTVFVNYESYEMIDECKTGTGLRLYEFKTHNQGFEYKIRYWVENDTDARVIVTMIVFPLESNLLLDEYSSKLFPDYSTCP